MGNMPFQLILTLMAGEIILENYEDWHKLHNVIFNDKTRTSVMHSLFKPNDFDLLKKRDSTIYYHHFGLSEEKYSKYEPLVEFFDITSLGVEDNKKGFINSFEGKDGLPIYAVQYHPEKNSYDRDESEVWIYNSDGRKISQLLSLLFISKARLSKHKMDEADRGKYDLMNSNFKGNYDTYDNHKFVFSKKS